MLAKLSLTHITECIASVLDSQWDERNQERCKYRLSDAGLAAFSVFYTQSPSFLSHQRSMVKRRGRSNAQSIFGLEDIPTDTHIRTLLDGIDAESLGVIYRYIVTTLQREGMLQGFQVQHKDEAYYLLALDGTEFHSSERIACQYCCTKQKKGKTRYHHSMVPPVLVHPEQKEVISLEPEFMTQQDGSEKQDCERKAIKRWLQNKAPAYNLDKVIVLCDDLHCHQPQVQMVRDKGWDFIFTCKPKSHKTLYEYLALGHVHTLTFKRWNGRFREIYNYRFAYDVPLRDSDDSITVNWCELTLSREDNDKTLYKGSFATSLTPNEQNIKDIISWGRTRWKTENENNNTLKTKGYNLEHNYGLADLLVSLLLLAFSVHTLYALFDPRYHAIRQSFGSRRDFFNNLRTLLVFHLFASWHHWLDFVIDSLEIPFDSS